MSPSLRLPRLPIDRYMLLIVGVAGVAFLLPARGVGATIAGHATSTAIGLLFFLYGARLLPQSALAGLRHWRLHLVVFLGTFVLFPLLGLRAHALAPDILSPPLYVGVMFLCALPSTVQSSIAFTSIARGNVPAALCSATASNLGGILLTPLLVGMLLGARGSVSGGTVWDIVLQLLVPFGAGQFSRRWVGGWVQRNRRVLGWVDRGSILLVVYTAFSEGVVAGIWDQFSLGSLLSLLLVDAVLLAIALAVMTLTARHMRFSREDEIAIVFCGSKKSLASGLPMASVLFAGPSVGLVVLPLMLFHQLQLMICAVTARRYASRTTSLPTIDVDADVGRARLTPGT
jgi:sodium/bile acid cotransporter 7